MHWHWLIIIYLFLGGLGAGAYLTSFAAEKGWLGKNSSLNRVGYFIAAPVVAFGTILLVFDLGQGLTKPWLLIRLLANFSSVMTWGVYILSAFIMVGLLKGYFAFRNKTAPTIISWAGAFLALATGAYTGLLLSVIEAVPFWNSGLMPILFVTSALSTGLSVTALVAPWVEKNFKEGREGEAHVYLIGAELIIVAIFFGMMNSGVYGSVGKESAALVISGVYSIVFWGYFIGLGLLFPLVVFGLQYLRSKQSAKQLVKQPSTVEREVAATVQNGHHSHSYLTIATDISVIVGGFALRAIIILAALPIWDGVTIP